MPLMTCAKFTKLAGGVIQVLMLFCSVLPAHAGPEGNVMSRSRFQVSAGDVNGDGRLDVLLRPTPIVINLPMGDDVELPLVIPPPIPTFVILSQADGGYSLNANPDQQLQSNPRWAADLYELVFGDVLGDGSGAVLIKARSSDAPSFMVALSAATGGLRLIQQLTPAATGVDLGAAGVGVILQDKNADGRADLLIYVDQRLSKVLLADSEGRFYNDDAATIQAVWRALLDALDAGNGSLALQYLSEESRGKYGDAFTSLRPRATALPAKFSGMQFIELTPEYARGVVRRKVGDGIHFVTFILRYGEWQVLEF
jgi:hypothetical protein